MEIRKQNRNIIEKLKDGERYFFNVSPVGAAVCWGCNGMYLLFEILPHRGEEIYRGTFFDNQLNDLMKIAYSWT